MNNNYDVCVGPSEHARQRARKFPSLKYHTSISACSFQLIKIGCPSLAPHLDELESYCHNIPPTRLLSAWAAIAATMLPEAIVAHPYMNPTNVALKQQDSGIKSEAKNKWGPKLSNGATCAIFSLFRQTKENSRISGHCYQHLTGYQTGHYMGLWLLAPISYIWKEYSKLHLN